jgi:hypothetical protein
VTADGQYWDDQPWVPTHLGVEARLKQTADGWDELHLYQQNLPELPDEVRGFRHVKAIYAYNSDLTVLPEWLAELPELTLLDVSGNSLTEVPFALLKRPGLELRIHQNPLDHGRMVRMFVEHYNAAEFEDVAAAFHPDVTVHLPKVRPANGTGRAAVATMFGDSYPRYGMVEVLEAGEHRAVVEPARAGAIELTLTWRYGRLLAIEGGRCPKPAV